mmetsp:Transcript_11318/g.12436  ORF Transcript_11318/g.12436 Transcript_11318/m.12436 type:complete len:229 (+) Transcript_11318:163-849(+)
MAQGILFLAAQKFNRSLQSQNLDTFILFIKLAMAYISTIKICLLIKMLQTRSLLLIFWVIILDAFGRNQLWRLLYLTLKSTLLARSRVGIDVVNRRGGGVRYRIGGLGVLVLCSEVDMDVLVFLMLLLVNVCGSPLSNGVSSVYHVTNEYLDLKDGSLGCHGWDNLVALCLVLVFGQTLTFWLSWLLGRHKLYSLRHYFAQSTVWSCWFAVFVSRIVLVTMFDVLTSL